MHIHILGICGTFMGSLALLAKQLGHRVTGCDSNIYPPMSQQLQANDIDIIEGYHIDQLKLEPDYFIIGNVLTRGNPLVEAVLNSTTPYLSGPAWLSHEVLSKRWVLAVSGTHGKTTATAMLIHILETANLKPGFLVGGVPLNGRLSAEIGSSPFFVIEADEYDSAFFDKRSKFVHYLPKTLIINNLEFDHADIFTNLAAIQLQFHHLVRLLPNQGSIIYPHAHQAIEQVLKKGCWTPTETFDLEPGSQASWHARMMHSDGSRFEVYQGKEYKGQMQWSLLGEHNVNNALAALLAARHVGISEVVTLSALSSFQGVKRRLEKIGNINGITVYDDFAHHPTAIASTLAGLHAQLQTLAQPGRILLIIEPRSNTMRRGIYQNELKTATEKANICYWFEPQNMTWDLRAAVAGPNTEVHNNTQDIINKIIQVAKPQDHIVIMSNGGFESIQQRLLEALNNQQDSPS